MIGNEDPFFYNTVDIYSQIEHELNNKFMHHYEIQYVGTKNDEFFLKKSLNYALEIPKGKREFVNTQIGIIKFAFPDKAVDIVSEVVYKHKDRITRRDKLWIQEYISGIKTGHPKDFVQNFKKLENKYNNFF